MSRSPAELRRLITRDVERDVHKGGLGRIVQTFQSQQVRPTADDVEILGLGDLAAAAEEAEEVSARAGEQASAARRRASRAAKDADVSTADKDAAELEAVTLEREARPLQSAAYKAVVDLVTEYRMALPRARAAYAAKASEAHRDAIAAHAALVEALDARDTAWRKIGSPDRDRHYSSDVGPASLGNFGTVNTTRANLTRMVEAFPTRAVERLADEEA